MSGRSACAAVLAAAAALLAACDPAPAPPLPPNAFAFGVFGDAPYEPWEEARYRRLLADVDRTPIAWLLEVGDLFAYPCSDEMYARRRAELDGLAHPVVYTPGDNEWTDCHRVRTGEYDPLERLAQLRRTFFPHPGTTLGTPPMTVESQAAEPSYAEFPENVRWRRGGFVFATIHMVGSGNGMEPFEGRTRASDEESARRMAAGIAWLGEAFDTARAEGAKGVVVAFHAEVGLGSAYPESREPFAPFLAELDRQRATFPGQVIVVQGDSHQERVDHPLAGPDGAPDPRFTRIETYGSPDVGWVRVVLDSVAGRVVRVEPRVMHRWW